MTYSLYRCYGKDGELLYVGISYDAMARLSAHRRAPWADEVVGVTVRHYGSRQEALDAERLAITTEGPRYNATFTSEASKTDVAKIVATLTVDAMCAALGVGRHAIRFAKTDGLFPGSWYGTLLPMCQEHGIDCPLSAFRWKSASPAQLSGGGE